MISTSRKALAALGLAVGCMSSFVPVSIAGETAQEVKAAPAATATQAQATPVPVATGTITSAAPASGNHVVAYQEGWSNGMPVPESRTYVQLDSLWLQRNRTSNFNVATTGAGAGPVALDLYNVQGWEAEPGPRFTLGYQMDNELAFEATYWGTNFWSQSAATPGAASSIFLNTTFDNLYDLGVKEQYTTRINNAELNLRRGVNQGGGFRSQGIFGLRFMNLEEAFKVTGVDAATASTAQAVANTNNYLFGLQAGADFSHCIFTPAFRVGTGLRGGLFVNYVDSDLRNQSSGPGGVVTTFANFGDQTTQLAGLIEWNFVMSLQVNKNLSVRGGYHMTYVPGVALASESMFSAGQTASLGVPVGGAGGAAIDRKGDIFVHGPFVGGELRF